MIAPANLPEEYQKWNEEWKAPYRGLFNGFINSVGRMYEYPWAYHAVPVEKGMKVLDYGGARAGFQFVLAKNGLEVHNLDPVATADLNKLPWLGYLIQTYNLPKKIKKLNKRFGTDVKLHHCRVDEAALKDNYFDIIYSISSLEHFSDGDLEAAARNIPRILRPGGSLVVTIDLFLDCYPFTDKSNNAWGRNISVKRLVDGLGMDMVHGKKEELCGYEQFNPENIMANKKKYFNAKSPLIETLVLKKKTS